MKSRLDTNNLLADELIRYQREEIERYRWIESEKAGRDIGWKRASEEWKQGISRLEARRSASAVWNRLCLKSCGPNRRKSKPTSGLRARRTGSDIGWEQAVTEWQDRHYRAWKDHLWATALERIPIDGRGRGECRFQDGIRETAASVFY